MTTYIPSITIPEAVFLNPAASVLLPIALGTAVGYGISPSETKKTYFNMKQPPLRPPPWVFGPVWTVLYATMGYAAHRAAKTGLSALASPSTVATTRHSLTLYSIQLLLNLVWTPLFFGLKRPAYATADILALLGVNGYLTYLWSGIDETSAWLQLPYMGWMSFATYLCVGAGVLNNWDLRDKEVKRE
ncbi:translocator protein [Emericellopsis atlantica]|uniref:Translocator protein n=1 Tax=Emericellopsis atlantica TaxID=2614577 RepID=A0A9P7ZD26_9HYPO|nr:translocator protein [Emericellopsis atlantica]KAG9249834.1 translocator protein [Emericellopsis atlantica]